MDKYVCKLELNQELLNGQITAVLDTYRTTHGPIDTICGYDVVEVSVVKGEMPLFKVGDMKYIGCKVENDKFISILCPIS